MASMAAAIAAARTAVSGNRPLDEKERNRFAYFSSLNSMAKKIMQDKERVRQRYGTQWEKMPPKEQDEAIDKSMVDPEVQRRYVLHRGAADTQPVPCYPVLKTQSGQKVVHFGEEDITWQDEHSAPFSWETRSQMEFSVASLSGQELATGLAQTETKQTPKPVNQTNQIKTPLGNPQVKNTPVARTPNYDGSTPMRKEEESAFWKISMERSRIEGSQSEFQSLTPSQIKSLEKGEKPLPVYYRQDSFQKEKEVSKPEKPTPLTEKPVVITKQPKTTIPSVVSLENSRPSQSSVSTLDDVFLPEPVKPVMETSKGPANDETVSTGPQLFSQINTSSMLLKTGFDFLDNW
ncbi:uncharacterized protein C1orf198 homolog isoform X2 [Rana temporaria]|uniref:uncharacterized protein C1orf198 homolog isoform X2 n=1 Tax=Rana temporaria TaxID=8407 RepID=UPI001AADC39B|nr:uncharacterized protein C1orf198 homolog isoform X2 [Rana temporaria]